MSPPRSQRAFTVAVALTAIAVVLPAGWLRWTGLPAEVLSVPIQPLADIGIRLGGWVRSPPGHTRESEELQRRTVELEATRALLYESRLRVEELLEEIEALQEARTLRPDVEMTPLFVRVTGRPPDRGRGPVRLNAGRRHGVAPGAIAVYRGGYLLGRVAEDGVARLSSRLVPLTDPASGLVEAVVHPADEPVASLEGLPRLQLAPDGRGGLAGDLDREVKIESGDIVRLADRGWPDSAQGLVIGRVKSVDSKDLEPLLNSITVQPRFAAQHVASVTLLVERPMAQAQGDGP